MHGQQLQEWLTQYSAEIGEFMDYEVVIGSEEVLLANLGGYWFRDPDWNEPGYRFLQLGSDGTGAEVAIWQRPDRPELDAVVFFGSEGGAGVLAATPLDFAQALAHGPMFDEYPRGAEGPSRLNIVDNWFLSNDDPKRSRAAREALDRYRQAVETHFGPLAPFEDLIVVPDEIQSEFRSWVDAVQARASERAAHEYHLEMERKRQVKRQRATDFAARSIEHLPSGLPPLRDGLRFHGLCANCSGSTTLRLIQFEEFWFGLCSPCYFSEAW